MVTIEGLYGIYATVLCDSISEDGIRLTTYELQYPRIIHSEFMTHSMLARNAASSRAIPFNKMVEQLNARPVRFGANQSGMQDAGEHDMPVIWHNDEAACDVSGAPEAAWEYSKQNAIKMSKAFSDAGYHKQVFNRLTEPFQYMKTVVTGTEWANFFWLRNHEDADPTIAHLADLMYAAKEKSVPQLLQCGEWHLPYIEFFRDESGSAMYYIGNEHMRDDGTIYGFVSYKDAIKVSAARCAAVSFRNIDYTLDKSLAIYDRLVGADRKHSSAFGHQATPIEAPYESVDELSINLAFEPSTWESGISHVDRDGQLWSAMLRGWVQFRKLIPGENYTGEI